MTMTATVETGVVAGRRDTVLRTTSNLNATHTVPTTRIALMMPGLVLGPRRHVMTRAMDHRPAGVSAGTSVSVNVNASGSASEAETASFTSLAVTIDTASMTMTRGSDNSNSDMETEEATLAPRRFV